MVIKVYVSLISCSQEIKKNQQRTLMILESKKIPYVAIDITDPCQEEAKDWVVATATPKPGQTVPVTPQLFNEADYCGDYDGLDMANECDTLGEFLKMTEEQKSEIRVGITGILPEDRERAKQAPPADVPHEDAPPLAADPPQDADAAAPATNGGPMEAEATEAAAEPTGADGAEPAAEPTETAAEPVGTAAEPAEEAMEAEVSNTETPVLETSKDTVLPAEKLEEQPQPTPVDA